MYVIQSSLDTDEPIMLINQPIGFDPSDPGSPYIDGALFQQELFELDNRGYKTIKLYINSPGGNVVEGYNICNAILKSKTPVDTYNTGICASMGAFIFMTGRKRVMADYSSMMVHNPFGGSDKKMLAALRESCVKLLSAKCGTSETELASLMDRETWLSPSECLEKGLCTEIEDTGVANQKRMPLALVSVRAAWKEANLIQSNINSNIENMDTNTQAKSIGTSLIAAYLELDVNASENAVLTALKNKVKTEILARSKAEDDMEEMAKKVTKMKAELAEMTDKYAAMVKEKEEADAKVKKDKEDTEAKAKKEKEEADAKVKAAEADAKAVTAKAMVEVYSKAGKIKPESVEKWVKLACDTNVEEVKAMLEEIPLNKMAVSAQGSEINKLQAGELPTATISYMAKIQANINAKKRAS